ncbi:HEPN domain-containing protein [Bdellovibrio sp. BCCA]|uniref:HEPN domain-containing protein n=1 Tax=Bdellovibrio sp. BCCA TaxID=3136281 RepID=UPI0030F05078
MKEQAKTLITKAMDDLALVEKLVSDERQHDNCGNHLAQTTEKFLKALCELEDLTYPKNGKNGHMLDLLFSIVRDSNKFGFIDDYLELIRLDVYDSGSRYDYVMDSERVNLNKYYGLNQGFMKEVLKVYKDKK